jgi:hypothetical protein
VRACPRAGVTVNLSHEAYSHAWQQRDNDQRDKARQAKPHVKEALKALSRVVSVASVEWRVARVRG